MKKLLFAILLMSAWLNADGQSEYDQGNKYFFEGKTPVNITKAVGFFKKGCLKNHFPSCYSLGGIYRSGKNEVKKDTKQAIKYYKMACDGGDADGCVGLGYTYRDSGDVKNAVKTLNKACEMSKNTIVCSEADTLSYSE